METFSFEMQRQLEIESLSRRLDYCIELQAQYMQEISLLKEENVQFKQQLVEIEQLKQNQLPTFTCKKECSIVKYFVNQLKKQKNQKTPSKFISYASYPTYLPPFISHA